MKRVQEYAAGDKIGAWIVIDPNGEYVGKVLAHYGQGTVAVDVFDYNGEFQQGRATGYGYDRFTCALSGLQINGIKFSDHCGEQLDKPDGGFHRDFDVPPGYSLANFQGDSCGNTYGSCFRDAGLNVLQGHGYSVIQAI